jgi:glutamate racemase
MERNKHVGIFDSGYGGLTVFKEIQKLLPRYNYIYLGDNARVPYGNRSFDTVLEFTWECVKALFDLNCDLVILACNTASAKALRSIQQHYLKDYPGKKVLGVIRPTTEKVNEYTKTNHVGILGTNGTVKSESYLIEINKFYPDILVTQLACPMWVPLIENNEHNHDGADYFVKKYLEELFQNDKSIDTIILACTHYPLIQDKIKKYLNENVTLISQGRIVAESLKDYLNRHPEVENKLSLEGKSEFYTTDDPRDFDNKAMMFIGEEIESKHLGI